MSASLALPAWLVRGFVALVSRLAGYIVGFFGLAV